MKELRRSLLARALITLLDCRRSSEYAEVQAVHHQATVSTIILLNEAKS